MTELTEALYLVRYKYGKTEERVYDVAVELGHLHEEYWITADGHRVYPEWKCALSELYFRDVDLDTYEKVIT